MRIFPVQRALNVDVVNGKVIPTGDSPETCLAARGWNFEGCIILNLGFVGTENGIGAGTGPLEAWRSAYQGRLLYGGGVASVADLETIKDTGFDGAIIATALHKGAVPAEWIREGMLVLVTLEGIDGTWKSTLADALRKLALFLYWFTREPGRHGVGEAVRRAVAEQVDSVTEATLFVADHAAHLATVVRPCLPESWPISDRYSG